MDGGGADGWGRRREEGSRGKGRWSDQPEGRDKVGNDQAREREEAYLGSSRSELVESSSDLFVGFGVSHLEIFERGEDGFRWTSTACCGRKRTGMSMVSMN
jgi:hypothetical protein